MNFKRNAKSWFVKQYCLTLVWTGGYQWNMSSQPDMFHRGSCWGFVLFWDGSHSETWTSWKSLYSPDWPQTSRDPSAQLPKWWDDRWRVTIPGFYRQFSDKPRKRPGTCEQRTTKTVCMTTYVRRGTRWPLPALKFPANAFPVPRSFPHVSHTFAFSEEIFPFGSLTICVHFHRKNCCMCFHYH